MKRKPKLGEGAGPSDALEFFFKEMEKVKFFPEIPEVFNSWFPTPEEEEEEPTVAASEDFTSYLFGIPIEAASPKSLERKKYQLPGASQARNPWPRMCYDTEGNAVPHSLLGSDYTKSLRSSLMALGTSSSLPILCSDDTVRVENSSRNVIIRTPTPLPPSNTAEMPPPTPPKSSHTKKVRCLGKKSASLPACLLCDKKTEHRENDTVSNSTGSHVEERTPAASPRMMEHHKLQRRNSPPQGFGTKTCLAPPKSLAKRSKVEERMPAASPRMMENHIMQRRNSPPQGIGTKTCLASPKSLARKSKSARNLTSSSPPVHSKILKADAKKGRLLIEI